MGGRRVHIAITQKLAMLILVQLHINMIVYTRLAPTSIALAPRPTTLPIGSMMFNILSIVAGHQSFLSVFFYAVLLQLMISLS